MWRHFRVITVQNVRFLRSQGSGDSVFVPFRSIYSPRMRTLTGRASPHGAGRLKLELITVQKSSLSYDKASSLAALRPRELPPTAATVCSLICNRQCLEREHTLNRLPLLIITNSCGIHVVNFFIRRSAIHYFIFIYSGGSGCILKRNYFKVILFHSVCPCCSFLLSLILIISCFLKIVTLSFVLHRISNHQ